MYTAQAFIGERGDWRGVNNLPKWKLQEMV
jgi:hypothetical protein